MTKKAINNTPNTDDRETGNSSLSENSKDILLISEFLKNTKETITIEYGTVAKPTKEGEKQRHSGNIRYYDEHEYTLAELEQFIAAQIQGYDSKLTKPRKCKKDDSYHSRNASSHDDLIKNAVAKMSSIINNIKRKTAEKHTLDYLEQHHIPLVPESEIKFRRDSFISSYGSDEEKRNGKSYGVIKSNPFPDQATPDIKLLTSRIRHKNNAEDIKKKRNLLCTGVYDILKAHLNKRDDVKWNCDLYGFEVKNNGNLIGYSGELDSGEYEKKGRGSLSSYKQESNDKKEPEVSFLIQINNELYSCPLEEYKKLEDQIKELQKSINMQPDLNFDHHFNSPTCGVYYISSEENFKVLGIRDLFRYTNDRGYGLAKGRFNEAMDSVLTEEEKNIFAAEEKKVKDIEANYALFLENRKRQKKIFETLEETKDVSREDLLEQMPAFVEHLMHVDSAHSIQINISNKLATYIRGYSDYNGSGGSEYGLYITAWYNGELQEKKVVYRDRYDPNRDDRGLCFKTLEVTNIEKSQDEKQITIQLLGKSDQKERSYEFTFDVNEEVKKPKLNREQQQEFTKKYEEAKQLIIQEQGEDFQRRGTRTMPVYCLPPEMCYNNMPQDDVSYESPRIVSEYVDPLQGRGAIIFKTQIDHSVSHKRQFAWEGYIINQDGTYTHAFRECAWDAEKKQIRSTAEELLK